MNVLDRIRSIPVSDVESDGRLTVGDRVAFTFTEDDGRGTRIAEGKITQIRKVRTSTFVLIDADGAHVTRHAADVQPVTDWRDRMDPVVVAGFGAGSGPLPILTHPDTGPHVEVSWMDGSVLLLGVYTTDRTGIVYRFDNGLEQPPTVIHWDLDGPECGCDS